MLPNTLFIGQQLYFLPACDSTNSEAQQLLFKNEATEGCTVITAHQTAGRGQRGNTWEAEPGKNITLSVVLLPKFLAIKHQFYLNIAVSLGVLDLIHELGLKNAQLKWPNDLYFEDKKLGGILIENSINSLSLQHSIVGIGLNVNQLLFENTTATSLANLLYKTLNLEDVTERLLELLEKRYLELRSGKMAKLKYDYLQVLYRYQEEHTFKVQNNLIRGQILGINDDGRLAVKIENELHYFAFKEIEFVI
jgi:BirA family transcriptional regulator, biotin operon repressor / biotin---[acetyl-CoA-carboxylase] ligase